MPFEKFDLQSLDKERRKAIAKSIRIISAEELRSLAKRFSIMPMTHGARLSSDSLLKMLARHFYHDVSRSLRRQYCLLP